MGDTLAYFCAAKWEKPPGWARGINMQEEKESLKVGVGRENTTGGGFTFDRSKSVRENSDTSTLVCISLMKFFCVGSKQIYKYWLFSFN